MPIYEYRCDECTYEFESLQKFSDNPLVECPDCHQEALIKLVSASSFRLKGGGWYETDFKTGSKKHGTQDSSPDASSSESGASSDSGASSESGASSKASDGNQVGKSGEKSKTGDSSSSSSTKADTAKGKSSTAANKS